MQGLVVASRVRTLVLGRVQVWHDLRLSPGRHSVSLTQPLVAPLPKCLKTCDPTIEFGVAGTVRLQVRAKVWWIQPLSALSTAGWIEPKHRNLLHLQCLNVNGVFQRP